MLLHVAIRLRKIIHFLENKTKDEPMDLKKLCSKLTKIVGHLVRNRKYRSHIAQFYYLLSHSFVLSPRKCYIYTPPFHSV